MEAVFGIPVMFILGVLERACILVLILCGMTCSTDRTTFRVPVTKADGFGKPNRARGPSYLVIVARDRPDLLRHLQRVLADWPDAEVISDRRDGGRWQRSQSREIQPKGVERRRPISREADVHSRAFLMVPRQDSQH